MKRRLYISILVIVLVLATLSSTSTTSPLPTQGCWVLAPTLTPTPTPIPYIKGPVVEEPVNLTGIWQINSWGTYSYYVTGEECQGEGGGHFGRLFIIGVTQFQDTVSGSGVNQHGRHVTLSGNIRGNSISFRVMDTFYFDSKPVPFEHFFSGTIDPAHRISGVFSCALVVTEDKCTTHYNAEGDFTVTPPITCIFLREARSRAVNRAMDVVGKNYTMEPGNRFTKGWKDGRFVNPTEIEYLDCSGLVFWAYNKALGTTKYDEDSPIPVGAHGQWVKFKDETLTEYNLEPGDLIFIDTSRLGRVGEKDPIAGKEGKIDHVLMYVGDGKVVHAVGGETKRVVKESLDEALNRPVDGKTYKDYRAGFGRVALVHSTLLDGDVELIRGGKERPLQLCEPILPGDTILTGENSKVTIVVPGGFQFTINENGTCIINADVELAITFGEIMAESANKLEPLPSECEFKITTPAATIEVRGTQFNVNVAKDGTTTLTVLYGVVELSDLSETKTVSVEQYQVSTVKPDGTPSDPQSIDPSQIDRWWEWEEEALTSTPSPTHGFEAVFALVGVLVGVLIVIYFLIRKRQKQVRGGMKKTIEEKQPLTATMRCPYCGAEVKPEDAFCAKCGKPVQAQSSPPPTAPNKCPSCGFEIQHDDIFCPNCGKKIKE